MEIEAKEWVRLKDGRIRQFKQYNEDIEFIELTRPYSTCKEKDIVTHSKNIIDLIEVGDYVNGYRVVAIMEDMETGEIHLEMTSDYTNETIGDCTIYNDDIKSIVTHEQMQSIEYKVEEDR